VVSADSIAFGVVVAALVLATPYLFKAISASIKESNRQIEERTKEESEKLNNEADQVSTILKAIESAPDKVNFVLGESPLELNERERVLVVLPKSTLWEPRPVRLSRARYQGASLRIAKGVWFHFGGYRGQGQSFDKLQEVDQGTMVLTDQRIAFFGVVRTVCMELKSILSVDIYKDGVGLHCKKRSKVEGFHLSSALEMTYKHGDQTISLPFTGQILATVINSVLRKQRKAVEAIQ
jgi:hypothetical protein